MGTDLGFSRHAKDSVLVVEDPHLPAWLLASPEPCILETARPGEIEELRALLDRGGDMPSSRKMPRECPHERHRPGLRAPATQCYKMVTWR
jgi:hypothetical protein